MEYGLWVVTAFCCWLAALILLSVGCHDYNLGSEACLGLAMHILCCAAATKLEQPLLGCQVCQVTHLPVSAHMEPRTEPRDAVIKHSSPDRAVRHASQSALSMSFETRRLHKHVIQITSE